MTKPSFQTLDELAAEFPTLKRGGKLHPLAKERLAMLLQGIWPDAYPKPEPGEMPAGRSDLALYFPDGRYAVFEIFVSVSQVPQDLRHLEQSAAAARIAILTDPLLDNGDIYSQYYAKKPRDPFPVLNLSEILVAQNETTTRQKLKEYIDEAFASEQEVSESTQRVASRLAELSLDDESKEGFGENRFTGGVARLDSRYVVIAAIPLDKVSCAQTNVLKAARSMLEWDKWYRPTPGDLPPRYWPDKIFRPPRPRHSGQNAVFWEDRGFGMTSVRSRLVITDRAEVFFVSSDGAKFVTRLDNGTGVFVLGRIVADCWKLSGLVAQLYSDIGHEGQGHLCVALIGTEGTVLGGFADGYSEPLEEQRWGWDNLDERDWTCHAPNVKYCNTVNVLAMEPKKLPEFVHEFAEAISLAYNYDSPLCFDKKTGLIPDRYL
jgi:hypothetical protein